MRIQHKPNSKEEEKLYSLVKICVWDNWTLQKKEVAGKLLVLVKEDGESKGKPPTLHQAYREDA